MTPTPLEKFESVYLKREDKNLTGSAKDRAVSYQVSRLISQGYHSAVISSTGNAAISAQYFCQKYGIELTVFVSKHISPSKLSLIKTKTITSEKPISDSFKFSKRHHAYLLRQSTDPAALDGYQQIAVELSQQLPQISSIFIPVGSGTTLLGISQKLPSSTKIFAIQPASHCPISDHFFKDYSPETTTVTDALSVKSLPLKNQVIDAINKSHGSGLVVQNQRVLDALSQVESSAESALALAGYYQALSLHLSVGDSPVILFTGTKR